MLFVAPHPARAQGPEPIDVSAVAATQAEAGHEAVTSMMNFWASKAKGDPVAFERQLREVAARPFPAISGPSLWNPGERRVYILDGHHRASAIHRLLHDDHASLPKAVRDLMSPQAQKDFAANPEKKIPIHVKLDRSYPDPHDMVRGLVIRGYGQLPAAIRNNPEFAKAYAAVRDGKPADTAALIAGYKNMAPYLKDLRDSPMRTAMGNALYRAGIDTDLMVSYIEFLTAERIEKELAGRGIKVTKDNATSPEITAAIQAAILGDKATMEFLVGSSRPGKETANAEQLRKAAEKFANENAAAALKKSLEMKPASHELGCPI